jgi:hypothetical protein
VLATFRLQGLVTLLTVYALRALAGFVSHRRRSWDSPFGAFSSRKVSAAFPRGRTHVLFRPPVFPLLVQWAGPTGCSFWALTLPGVPGGRCRISASATGCSLGLFPLRVFRKGPCRTLVRTPPTRFAKPILRPMPPAPRSINRPLPGSVRDIRQAARADRATLPGFWHQCDPECVGETLPGLCVHLLPRRASLPTDRQSLGSPVSLYRSHSGCA